MDIKVFSRAGDPYSDMLRNILKYHNVEFENIEVSRDAESFGKLLKESGQSSTPVLVVDGKVYVGFDHKMIKNVLGMTEDKT